MRLSEANIAALAPEVARPAYDRAAQKCGIVHFGIGAFHRAHQAVYTDDAMAAGDRDWGIIGVSLRSAEVRDQMASQDGLYIVAERDGKPLPFRSAAAALSPGQGKEPLHWVGVGRQRLTETSVSGDERPHPNPSPEGEGLNKHTSLRLIGAVRSVLVASEQPQAVIEALASADTHVVTFTITEKGYCRRADGTLDVDGVAVAHDLSGAGDPRTIYGFLARALARRRAGGLPGLSLVSCDNLAENGTLLAALLDDFLGRIDPALAAWARAHCTCPSTMIDRIVPATTPADLATIAAAIGLDDAAAVVAEPFRQWVIEDRFAGPRPRWEVGGAQLVPDVQPYETAKLRMLNGAHSALAYLGLRQGHDFVHQAIADPAIRPLIEQLMRHEAAATLDPLAGLDPGAYADALLDRFGNDALPHRLIQIAMDGSQKIPQRWLKPIAINRAAGRDCPATLAGLAAWIVHVRGDARPVDDPMAVQLAALWREAGAEGIVPALFGADGLFAANWTASPEDQQMLTRAIGAFVSPERTI